jgi:hypothetical protein
MIVVKYSNRRYYFDRKFRNLQFIAGLFKLYGDKIVVLRHKDNSVITKDTLIQCIKVMDIDSDVLFKFLQEHYK